MVGRPLDGAGSLPDQYRTDLHWNADRSMYCDLSVDNDGECYSWGLETARTDWTTDESYHVCHRGYISIFPFLLGLLPTDSPHLDAILDDVKSPDHLWSDYGIRSLAKSDEFFGEGENYWRGPIWIPINYMALRSLHTVNRLPPFEKAAADVRTARNMPRKMGRTVEKRCKFIPSCGRT